MTVKVSNPVKFVVVVITLSHSL